MCEYGDVRVEMCEWSGHNVRVNMECASQMCEWCGHNVRVQ